ncbi:MAG: head morphogenesis protein [Alphaproteobacteria bacterium]|nr:MAG: head morphogenesis protein [Alphaproteobacteria bacterium]
MAEFTDKPGYAFNPGAPPEVAAFFRNKGLRPSFDWQDVEPEEHAVAFSVAKAMQVDVLEAIQGALQEAIDEGIPYDQFAKELRPRLRRLGWWGVKEQVDPITGEVRKVRLGSPRRLKTIYRANIRSARAAGQWARIQRTKDTLPYLVYLLGPSEHHRPHHQAKEGLVLPVDDPFWQSWYPPNGWGCKCHVRQITRREAERRGISDSPDIPMREVFNRRTGEIKRIPSGIDPGWEMNPGLYRQRQMERFLAGKLDAADPAVAHAAARDMAKSWRMRRILEGSANGSVPVAMLPPELAERFGVSSRVVLFSDQTATKQAERRILQPDQYGVIADAIETGEVAFEKNTLGAHRLIFESQGDEPWRITLKRTVAGDEMYLVSLYRSTRAKWSKRKASGRIELWREW